MIQTTTSLPMPTHCPICGYIDRTTICRMCKTDKTVKRKTTDQEIIFQKILSDLKQNSEVSS